MHLGRKNDVGCSWHTVPVNHCCSYLIITTSKFVIPICCTVQVTNTTHAVVRLVKQRRLTLLQRSTVHFNFTTTHTNYVIECATAVVVCTLFRSSFARTCVATTYSGACSLDSSVQISFEWSFEKVSSDKVVDQACVKNKLWNSFVSCSPQQIKPGRWCRLVILIILIWKIVK